MHVTWRSEPGAVLGDRYRLETSLGLTEAGERFEGVDLRDDAAVIITALHPQLFSGASRGPNTLRVQRSRAYVHARMTHIRDIVLSGPDFYVISEPEPGASLERWVLGRLPLTNSAIRGVASQVVEALECVHLIGVHGNLQPANIYIAEAGDVTVCEPWFLEGADALQEGEVRARQAQWTAPEQRSGGWQERHETDVFLFGALVGWLIAGRAVAPGMSLREQQVEVDERLDTLLLRATAERPEDRFHDVGSFWAALESTWAEIDDEVAAGVADEAEGRAAVSSPPPLEVVSALVEPDDEGEHTEAIPLAEIERMGLDAGIDADASHVDAIIILDGDADAMSVEPLDGSELEELEPILLVTDTSFIPSDQLISDAEVVDAIVEVGIIDRGPVNIPLVPSEERTIQVVPGPGSARALEAARLAEVRRRAVPEVPETPSSAPPAPRVRSRAVYVAPFLALLAGGAMFWVLNQALGDEEASSLVQTSRLPSRTEGVEAVRAETLGLATAGAEPDTKMGEVEASASVAVVADTATSAATSPDAQASEATSAADSSGPTKAIEQAATSDAGEPASNQPATKSAAPSYEDMEAEDYRCPGGMAKVRSRRKVTLPDGTTKRRRVVWCTDRYEFPGKGAVPTTNVTLAAAKTTCRTRGRRLCRRSEWRGACGGSKYPYRGDYDASRCNTVAPGGIPRAVAPAGSKSRCRGGFGTYDMTGNVAEWTSDGTVNGGSAYKDGKSGTCYRSSRRTGGSPYVGFRCCADPIHNEPEIQDEGGSP
jgi:hypothetical protein